MGAAVKQDWIEDGQDRGQPVSRMVKRAMRKVKTRVPVSIGRSVPRERDTVEAASGGRRVTCSP